MLYDSSSISDSHHNGQICYVVSCVGVCMRAWEEKKIFLNTFNKTFSHHILTHPNPRHNNLPN